ncbi:MAG: DNA polymerase Y family protein [Pseudomonadota bacterium]
MTGRRVVSIFLPHLSIERWTRVMERTGNAPPDDLPVAMVAEGPHGPVIHDINRAAGLAGVQRGARVTDMKALLPDLRIEYADIVGDRRAMEQLMFWVRRWCPWSVQDGVDGLVLDTTGSDHLWGGEAKMLADMEAQFSMLGLTAQIALAPTWGAAWALARYGTVRSICPEGEIPQKLSALSVDALRLNNGTVTLLRRLGLKTIGALADVPRLSLTRRFVKAKLNENPVIRLDQAMGHTAEPVSSPDAAPSFRAHARLPEPIMDPTPFLPDLCADLCDQMEAQGYGCRRLLLTVYHTDGDTHRIEVAMSVHSRDPDHLLYLFRDKLEAINPGYGFDLITLDAAQTEQMEVVQAQLEGGTDEAVDLSRLTDRLTARFGTRAVTRPALRESHVPERAQNWVAALGDTLERTKTTAPDRPIRLLYTPEEVRVLYAVPKGPPVQFIWRRQTHKITRYAGPERIAPEWWHDKPGTRLRDYFKVEDHRGSRFWLYREGLHGDGRGGDPRWFVHGMFA